MPAVDAPEAYGLTYAEQREVMPPLLSSEWAAGLEVTIYDPDRDDDGTTGRRLTDFLVGVLEVSSQLFRGES